MLPRVDCSLRMNRPLEWLRLSPNQPESVRPGIGREPVAWFGPGRAAHPDFRRDWPGHEVEAILAKPLADFNATYREARVYSALQTCEVECEARPPVPKW